jgi:hypothetical protein
MWLKRTWGSMGRTETGTASGEFMMSLVLGEHNDNCYNEMGWPLSNVDRNFMQAAGCLP